MNDHPFDFNGSAMAYANAIGDVPLVLRDVLDLMGRHFTFKSGIVPLASVFHRARNVLLPPVFIPWAIVVVGAERAIGDVSGALRWQVDEAKDGFE
jgi:hypothetical protein